MGCLGSGFAGYCANTVLMGRRSNVRKIGFFRYA